MTMIRLTIPADATFLTVLRATAGAIAARAPLTIDQVDDVRMAVEEAGVLLLPSGQPVTLSVDPSAMPLTIDVGTEGSDGVVVESDSLAWIVLQGMTDRLEVLDGPDGTTLRLVFEPVATSP